MEPKDKRPTVVLPPPGYQPTAAELEEDLSVDASFDEAMQALVKPVDVVYDDN